ncbi:MAG: ParB/RepB/Spo0J family partition protein [Cellulosilyticaceae bacterium]
MKTKGLGKGLGKGLNALLSEELLTNSTEEGVKMINLNEIDTNSEQPRKKFDSEELYELCLSIQEYGILQPILVRQKGNRYEIIAGERRYRAARLARLPEVPVIIKAFSDQETLEVSIVENIQRENLNPMELANGYRLLIDKFGYNQDKLAEKLGKSRPLITNILRLLQLYPYAQEKLRDNEMSFGHARAILPIKDEATQEKIVDYIVEKELSVRETEKYVQLLLEGKNKDKEKKQNENTEHAIFYKKIEEQLQKKFGTKVSISKGKKKGKIEIEYYSDEELERLLEIFQN